ncbi:hypothetical protein F4774DRAFT_375755 [Daldinia eschscholtzii]|nr:hypothetical protein F4774DRAFT_375755 [Daldinia eschscholtzii]
MGYHNSVIFAAGSSRVIYTMRTGTFLYATNSKAALHGFHRSLRPGGCLVQSGYNHESLDSAPQGMADLLVSIASCSY